MKHRDSYLYCSLWRIHLLLAQNLSYNRPPPLLTLPTKHTTATHLAPSPTHYNTPPATQYLTTHQITVPLYPNPPPLHAIPYTTSPSSTPLNQFILLEHLHSHHKHIIILFPASSSHLNPTPHTSIHRTGTSEPSTIPSRECNNSFWASVVQLVAEISERYRKCQNWKIQIWARQVSRHHSWSAENAQLSHRIRKQ